jgi:murein L,D-transpeptidase YafK
VTTVAGTAETRLMEIYRLAAHGENRNALSKAASLVNDYPTFLLAQLVYGDLLAARIRPLNMLGDVPPAIAQAAAPALADLRDESQMRLKALRYRPPAGGIPSQFLSLSSRNKHAIAVDLSRARLYLFENTATGLSLIADFYVSVGKSGAEKSVEGDLRTPLGVYFITSNLDPKTLRDFYGSGALPINYPNALDNKRGKTGGGIWLHGTPPDQFSRAPLATDGCVALSNPDLDRIIRTVEIRTTPVVIATHLQWDSAQTIRAESKPFEDTLEAWREAKSGGNINKLLDFYTQDFNSFGKTLREWSPLLRTEVNKLEGRPVLLKNLSYLRWKDTADTMVVTFSEVVTGLPVGPVKRQYWIRQDNRWKVFFEGVVG